MNTKSDANKSRVAYLDFIRVTAIALVIVNHTDGPWMLSLESQNANWWFAVICFFICKIAVPLFVMVSGALLLPRSDTYRKTGSRIVRIVIALVAASIFYYLTGNFDHSIVDFIDKFWHAKISSPLWYLYMYIGLLAMTPLLQKLASTMRAIDFAYFFAICYGVVNLVPVISQFFPAAAYTGNLQLPLFTSYIGMFMAGHFLANIAKPEKRIVVAAAAIGFICLVFLVAATALFYNVNDGTNYLKMDNRTFTPIVLMAASVFFIVRYVSYALNTSRENKRIDTSTPTSETEQEAMAKQTMISTNQAKAKVESAPEDKRGISPAIKLLNTIALCSFGMYLTHSYFINMFRPYFLQACEQYPDILALCVFQIAVFIASFAITWLLRLIPPVRKIL